MTTCMSLKQILLESKMASLDNNDVEVYKMIDKEAGGDAVEKTIIVKLQVQVQKLGLVLLESC